MQNLCQSFQMRVSKDSGFTFHMKRLIRIHSLPVPKCSYPSYAIIL